MPYWQIITTDPASANYVAPATPGLFYLGDEPPFQTTNVITESFFFDPSVSDGNQEEYDEKWEAELARVKPNNDAVKPSGLKGFIYSLGNIAHECLNKVILQIRFNTIGAAKISTVKHTQQMLTGCIEITAKQKKLEDERFKSIMQQFKENIKKIEKEFKPEHLALQQFHDANAAAAACIERQTDPSLKRHLESLTNSHELLRLRQNGSVGEINEKERSIRSLPCGQKIIDTHQRVLHYFEEREHLSDRIGNQLNAAFEGQQTQPKFDTTIEDPQQARSRVAVVRATKRKRIRNKQ